MPVIPTIDACRVDISVIIVNWNTKELLMKCVSSVYRTLKKICFEIVMVDNGSGDGSVDAVQNQYPDVRVIANERNLGFAAANNQALQRILGRYALLLNTDAELTEGAVDSLYDFMERHSDAGMACGQLLNPDGSKQNSIANLPSLMTLISNETVLRVLFPGRFPSKLREYLDPIEVESCIGACILVRKEAVDDVGLLDERFFFFFEETDWSLRMRNAGWKIYFIPGARIIHGQGESAEKRTDARILFYRSRYAYFRKWHRRSFFAMGAILFIRLLVNTALTVIGVGLTCALHKKLRHQLWTYIKLIVWHAKGCPAL
ncbi:MAG: hypothetical protein A2V65_04045 [Deltaproteobacteria bacterium RBG_13_49_15]|nr:MAG: hypothetical protein A2V65_04045 [Deltaproteobacteria bacterium RBG_13_49_15]